MNAERSKVALFMIAALAQIAWADGALLPGEARFFGEVIDGLELPPDELLAAWRSLTGPPRGLQPLPPPELTAQDQRQVLVLGYAMAQADGSISDEELGALRALGQSFGLAWKDVLELVGHPLAW